jgi:hypothetical protein
MIVVDEKKVRLRLDVEVPHESIIEFRRLLFAHGVSLQEFLAFLFVSSQMNEKNVMDLIGLTKIEKLKNNLQKSENTNVRNPTSANALYNLLEKKSPLKQQR